MQTVGLVCEIDYCNSDSFQGPLVKVVVENQNEAIHICAGENEINVKQRLWQPIFLDEK
jgi:hypothetical protein